MTRSRYVAQAGIIAAIYAALTLIVLQLPSQLGWGLVQFRVSEAVTVVALFTPAGIPGLAIGTMVANAFMLTQVGPLAMLDVVFGSVGSLLGAAWMWRFRKRPSLALAGPVIANALIVPAYLPILLKGFGLYQVPFLGIDLEGHWLAMYLFGVVAIALGEAIVVYGLGLPLYGGLKRLGLGRLVEGS
ncbi:MAG: QueT transporter family protein [Coriobacteriia bacterium]|nr:QueT transporter family protein [Coriobacteriia bacterium]MBN2822888.1 QueT transporter family protein [Coriobacteriia bacterium]